MSLLRSVPTSLVLALSLLSQGPVLSAQAGAREIPITAAKFSYSPEEVRLKKGETVVLVLKSDDVTHGMKSSDLGFNVQIKAGEETRVTVTPQQTGTFTASCSKFCGAGHFGMKMTFIVE